MPAKAFGRVRASVLLGVGLLLGAVVSSPVGAAEKCSSQGAIGPEYIPFLYATVERRPGGYQVEWSASHAGNVRLQFGPHVISNNQMTKGASRDAGHWLVRRAVAGAHPSFRLMPDCGAPLVIAARDASRPNISNLRDVGGYRTTDGRWVRMGLAYRSNDLGGADTADLRALELLNIATVVDMRHATERQQEPDKLPAYIHYIVADVFGDPAAVLADAPNLIDKGRGSELMELLNRAMVSSPAASEAFSAVLRSLADEREGSVVFHCTAGKDRTGWASAVLLTLLGVPRETVYQDYLLSNRYRARDIRAGVRKHSKLFVPLERVERAYLDAAFDEVDRRYGSFDAYVHKGLKLDDDVIGRLRRKFLQGQPG